MYRRPKFLEVLHAIREDMSREADYDVDLFAEMVRSGVQPSHGPQRVIRGFRTRAPRAEAQTGKSIKQTTAKTIKPATEKTIKHRQRKRGAQ
jgi:hypothetical protein